LAGKGYSLSLSLSLSTAAMGSEGAAKLDCFIKCNVFIINNTGIKNVVLKFECNITFFLKLKILFEVLYRAIFISNYSLK